MSRVIQTGSTPAKRRNAHMRSCAEVLRLLSQRPTFEEEEKDMCAFLVLNLRGIFETIDQSAATWDERNYWKKAETLRHDWRWARLAAEQLEHLVRYDRWADVPEMLIGLVPRFAGVKVTTITRDADWWCGARRSLLAGDRDQPAHAGDQT